MWYSMHWMFSCSRLYDSDRGGVDDDAYYYGSRPSLQRTALLFFRVSMVVLLRTYWIQYFQFFSVR
jgi:hypothetical protein